MLFECEQEELLKGIQSVEKAVSSRSTLPILSGILFQLVKNNLRLTATDLELTISCDLEVKTEQEGVMVVPARLVTDIIRNLPGGIVKVKSTGEEQINITSSDVEYSIKTLPPEDFPKQPIPEGNKKTRVNTDVVVEAIKQVIKAASKDEARTVLTGVLLKVKDGKIKMVATDSYRLALTEKEVEGRDGTKITAIIPTRVLEEIIRSTAGKEHQEAEVALTESQVIFNIGGKTIISRVIEGEFPDYERILPKQFALEVVADKEKLIGAVRRVSLLAQNTPLRMRVTPGKVEFSAQTAEIGEAREELKVAGKGGSTEIAFNPQYLLDGLEAVRGDKVKMSLIDSTKPALIESASSSGDFLYLVMPVRIT